MRRLGLKSCLADPNVWFKDEVRPSDGFKYYAYALLYVDDALLVHHDAEGALRELDHYFKMKPGSTRTSIWVPNCVRFRYPVELWLGA
jgi:hypothetical protein